MELVDKYLDNFFKSNIKDYMQSESYIKLNSVQLDMINKMHRQKGSIHIKPRSSGKTTAIISHIIYSSTIGDCYSFIYVSSKKENNIEVERKIRELASHSKLSIESTRNSTIYFMTYREEPPPYSLSSKSYIYFDDIVPLKWNQDYRILEDFQKVICTFSPMANINIEQMYSPSLEIIESLS